jgi:hypothetical protein
MARSERDNAPPHRPLSASASLRVNDAILDGEIICADETGRPIFIEMLRGRHPVCFVAFDLLWLNGEDLCPLPLVERKARLKRLRRRRSDHLIAEALAIEGRGKALFALSRRTTSKASEERSLPPGRELVEDQCSMVPGGQGRQRCRREKERPAAPGKRGLVRRADPGHRLGNGA